MFARLSIAVTKGSQCGLITTVPKCTFFRSSKPTLGLEEFFTGYDNLKVGRSWSAEQLRLKATEDLEKLHYVCLKELNMLMTYKHFIKRNPNVSMIGPERVQKVKKTMQLIQHVVHERKLVISHLNNKPGFLEHRNKIRYLRDKEKERDAKNAEKAKSVYSVNMNDKTLRRKNRTASLSPRV